MLIAVKADSFLEEREQEKISAKRQEEADKKSSIDSLTIHSP